MRLPLLFAALLLATPVAAENVAAERSDLAASAVGTAVAVNISYTINAPLTATVPEEIAAEERQYIRMLYQRATRECEDLMATIAAACQITGLNVSTQVTRNPGQIATIYVTSNVTLQIALRK